LNGDLTALHRFGSPSFFGDRDRFGGKAFDLSTLAANEMGMIFVGLPLRIADVGEAPHVITQIRTLSQTSFR